jgi:hypothetical protein
MPFKRQPDGRKLQIAANMKSWRIARVSEFGHCDWRLVRPMPMKLRGFDRYKRPLRSFTIGNLARQNLALIAGVPGKYESEGGNECGSYRCNQPIVSVAPLYRSGTPPLPSWLGLVGVIGGVLAMVFGGGAILESRRLGRFAGFAFFAGGFVGIVQGFFILIG